MEALREADLDAAPDGVEGRQGWRRSMVGRKSLGPGVRRGDGLCAVTLYRAVQLHEKSKWMTSSSAVERRFQLSRG
ncbi:hypothetical protein AO715_10315 [Xanthomonas sp. Mitacek01]|nr:hypothetical protein AO715_10315 [Xanthomonas sp. Mitacek01]